jgi:hypothetical protein
VQHGQAQPGDERASHSADNLDEMNEVNQPHLTDTTGHLTDSSLVPSNGALGLARKRPVRLVKVICPPGWARRC